MLEILATLFHYTPTYCLYRLSFSQAISLIDIHNEREKKAQDAAEERSREESDDGYTNPDKFKDAPAEELPTMGDLKRAFGGMLNG